MTENRTFETPTEWSGKVPTRVFVDESLRILRAASEVNVPLKMLGGLAIKVHSLNEAEFANRLGRSAEPGQEYSDIDLATYYKSRDGVRKVMEELGYSKRPSTMSTSVSQRQIDGNLLIDRDPVLQTTSGQLTNYQISSGAAQNVSQTINNQSVLFSFTASRSVKIAGFVDTSAGRVTMTIDQSFSFTNNQVLDLVNFLENLKGTETITTSASTTSSQETRTVTVSDSYPVAMTSAFMIPGAVASSNSNQATLRFILPATVDQSFIRAVTTAVSGVQILSTTTSDTVHSEAVLVRSLTTGFSVVASGHDYEDYILSDSTGLCFNHYIAAAQGFITVDTMRPVC